MNFSIEKNNQTETIFASVQTSSVTFENYDFFTFARIISSG